VTSLKEGWKYAPNFWKKNIKNDVGPINDNGVWKTRYSNELYTLYDELDSESDKNKKNRVAGTAV
jgi:hypothetical protein